MNYDVVKYDASDIRNKSVIDNIAHHNMSDRNIMSMFFHKVKKIAIVMDEIDGMNNGDKGGINSLIKVIRPKKTKKQKLEEQTRNPIICIGNYHIDKKINELMRNKIFYNIFQKKTFNDNTKQITHRLFTTNFSIYDHINLINDTDRTIIGLLWHENIINYIQKEPLNISIPFYLKVLDNICFSDYIDRITFQKQIWQFNEMTSLIKTFYNNKLFHEHITLYRNCKKTSSSASSSTKMLENSNNIRFTKVLTKYSTEYNNNNFILNMCQILNMEQKDLFSLFFYMKDKYKDNEIYTIFENTDLTRLDINRLSRFLDKYTTENAIGVNDIAVNEDKISDDDEIIE